MQNAESRSPFLFFLMIGLWMMLWGNPAHAIERIVALNPMVAEWAAEILGKEKALKKLVGASEFSHYPEFMKTVPTVGPYPNIQAEKVLSLKPDLVIGSVEYNRPEQIEKLVRLKLNVKLLPKEEFSNMKPWLISLGQMIGEEKKASDLATQWNQRILKLTHHGKTKKVFLQIQFEPLITVGSSSFLNEIFKMIGFENIFQDVNQSYPKVSKEAVLEKRPDEVFVFEMVKNQEDLARVSKTWKKSKITILNGDDFARCSFRLLNAAERLNHHE
jgi:ABC-type Fe3+-hydroxamate transport system substrate-binding protein